MLSFELLNQFPFITHFCTTREGGISIDTYATNNLSPYSGDDFACSNENKTRLCHNLGINTEDLIIPFQTHGTEIREINKTFFQLDNTAKQQYLHGVDALITTERNVCIGVTTADCVPLLFVDKANKVVAAAHAGWRGTCGRIAEKVINVLTEKYNSDKRDIFVTIGPSISPDVYEVGEELIAEFETAGFSSSHLFKNSGGRIYLDLWKANEQLLLENEIPKEHIYISGICTYTSHKQFFSARRLGITSGRMLTGIMLK